MMRLPGGDGKGPMALQASVVGRRVPDGDPGATYSAVPWR